MENQRFNSNDVVTVYGALATCVVAVLLLLQGTWHSMGGSEAQVEMVKLSRQVLSDGVSSLSPLEASSRGLASTNELDEDGRIGKDPWGQPYHYRIFQSDQSYKAVVIWSVGPNGIRDTQDSDILLSQNGRPLRIISRSDDLAHIESGL